MANNENQKTYFIFIRSTGEKVPVSKEQHDAFYKEADRIRHKEQDHGRCMCPYRYAWKCDGDCIGCEYHAAGDTLSLDVTNPDGNGNMYDYLPNNNTPIEELISDRILLEQLFARLRELDPEADTIIQLWMDHPEGISDRAIARELGRPQKTFADQMSGGMILKDATIFGQSGGTLLGGGEAGDEAVVGVSSLRSMIQDAVSGATLSVSGDQPLINIEEMSVRSDDDIRKISQQLNTLLTAGRRAKGLV